MNTDKLLAVAVSERKKLALLQKQTEHQKIRVEEAEKALLRALSVAHAKAEPGPAPSQEAS